MTDNTTLPADWAIERALREGEYVVTSVIEVKEGPRRYATIVAFARAIEQHEAFRREVSEAASLAKHLISEWVGSTREDGERAADYLTRFIIPKPVDPLVDALNEMGHGMSKTAADTLRAAMKARGYEWTKIGAAAQ